MRSGVSCAGRGHTYCPNFWLACWSFSLLRGLDSSIGLSPRPRDAAMFAHDERICGQRLFRAAVVVGASGLPLLRRRHALFVRARAACFSHNLKGRGFVSAQSAVIVWKPLEVWTVSLDGAFFLEFARHSLLIERTRTPYCCIMLCV